MKIFTRGQRSRLDALTPSSQLTIGLSIAAPSHVELDYGCFGVDDANFLADERYFVFYNQPRSPNDSIALQGAGAGDDERFGVNLEALPDDVRRLVFTATIDGVGTMMQIARGHLRVLVGDVEIVRYEFFGTDFHSEQALLIAEIYWKDTWRFGAIGQGFAGDLRTLLRHFGGVEEEVSQPVAQPAPVVPPRQPPPVQAPPVHTPSPPTSPPVPLVSSTAPPPPTFPVAPGVGESLQSLVDAAPAGSTLALLRGEYQGPLIINKALHLDGRKAVIWAHQGPVVTVAAPGVTLRDMEIEVTVPEDAQGDGDIALLADEQSVPQLQNVVVRGRLCGLGEDGEWKLPATLDLGAFAPRGENSFLVHLAVPVACRLNSAVAGLTCSPDELSPGEHDIELRVQGVSADTLIAGRLEVRSAHVVRAIALTGGTVGGGEPVNGKRLW